MGVLFLETRLGGCFQKTANWALIRGTLKTLSNIYDGAFLRKQRLKVAEVRVYYLQHQEKKRSNILSFEYVDADC